MVNTLPKKEYIYTGVLEIKETFEQIRKFFYDLSLFMLLLLALSLAIWLKSKNLGAFYGDSIFLYYIIILTTFQLFRLVSVVFYKHSLTRVINELPLAVRLAKYEPKVTCVIPCMNEEGAIRSTIRQCYAAHYPREKLEVIVINDGSTDRTAEILAELKAEEYPDLKIINWYKNRGKREGMNAGFREATGEIIIQLDSDSYIVPETFKKLIEPFKNPAIGAVCAHADPANAEDNWISKMQAAYYFMSFRILKAAESTFGMVFCCSGCSSAYRKKMVMPVLEPWLAESFLGQKVTWGDDRALTSYIIKSGYKTIYTDEARAVTIVPTTLRQLFKQQTRWKKSWIVNAFFTSKFIWRTDPFMAFIYYYPLIILSILTPIMAARALLYVPFFVSYQSLTFYFLGVLTVTAVLIIICKLISTRFKYWPYLFIWAVLNMFVLTFTLFYAAATIQNRSWGTR